MSLTRRVVARYLAKKADSDGSYMSVQSLQSLHDHSAELLQKVGPDTRLPDWVESKIDRAAANLLDVMEYMAHGEGALSPKDRGF
jgi:hypothetical protein